MTEKERKAWEELADWFGDQRPPRHEIQRAINDLVVEQARTESPLPPEGMVVEIKRGANWVWARRHPGYWETDRDTPLVITHPYWRYLPPHWTGDNNVRLILGDGGIEFFNTPRPWEWPNFVGQTRRGKTIVHVDIRDGGDDE